MIEKINRLLIVFTTFALFGIVLFTDNILSQVYGSEYESGYVLLVLLFLGSSFRLLSIPSVWILLSREKQYLISKLDIFRIILISLSMIFLLYSNLIDVFIALGSSWLIGEFIYFAFCLYFSRLDDHVNINLGLDKLAISLLLLPSILLSVFLGTYGNVILEFEFFLIAIFLAYWYLIILSGIINKKEITEILEAFRPRKLFIYFKSELNGKDTKKY